MRTSAMGLKALCNCQGELNSHATYETVPDHTRDVELFLASSGLSMTEYEASTGMSATLHLSECCGLLALSP
jgi:hypothetical protein